MCVCVCVCVCVYVCKSKTNKQKMVGRGYGLLVKKLKISPSKSRQLDTVRFSGHSACGNKRGVSLLFCRLVNCLRRSRTTSEQWNATRRAKTSAEVTKLSRGTLDVITLLFFYPYNYHMDIIM